MFNCNDFPDYMRSEVMQAKGEMFCTWPSLMVIGHFNAAHVIFKCSAFDNRCRTMNRKRMRLEVLKQMDDSNNLT